MASLAPDAAGLVALLVEAPPEPHERVALPLVADRGRVGVAGLHARLGRQLHQHFHDRVPEVGEARRPGRAHAADGALEERVAGEHVVAVDHEVEHPGRVPRRVQRLHVQAADVERVAGLDRAIDLVDRLRLERVREHLDVTPRCRLGDVVVVVVGQEQRRDLHAEPLAPPPGAGRRGRRSRRRAPLPPSSSATRKVFDSQSSFMERSMITAARSLVSGGRGRPAHPVPRLGADRVPQRRHDRAGPAPRPRGGAAVAATSSSRGAAAARPTSRAASDGSTCCARAWPP